MRKHRSTLTSPFILRLRSSRAQLGFLGALLILLYLLHQLWTNDGIMEESSLTCPALTHYTSRQERTFSKPSEIPQAVVNCLDAILVLGGGVPSTWKSPPIYVMRRAQDAAVVAKRRQKSPTYLSARKTSGIPILCLSAGTAHLAQLLSPNGLPIWESTACAAYLAEDLGVPKEDLFVETTSYDTIGNAFYARTTHTDLNGWRNLLVITNDFHMDRTAEIFDWIFLGLRSTSIRQREHSSNYHILYLSSENVGLSEEAVRARKTKEEQSSVNVRDRLSKSYTTLPQVWEFLATRHSLYSAGPLVNRAQGIRQEDEASKLVKKSYGASA